MKLLTNELRNDGEAFAKLDGIGEKAIKGELFGSLTTLCAASYNLATRNASSVLLALNNNAILTGKPCGSVVVAAVNPVGKENSP